MEFVRLSRQILLLEYTFVEILSFYTDDLH